MKAGPDDVFWFVEMHFLPSRLPKWSLQEYPRILICGERVITVGILFNAAGNCTALPLVVLRPDERPDSSRINPGELEVVVRYTKSGRLTPEIFTEYMDEINNDHFSKDRRVVILVCNEGHRITEPVLGHLHGTFGAGMYEPLVSTTVDLQMLIEQFKIELGTYMSAVEYVDCDETLLEEAGIEFEPVSSGSGGGGGELCIPEGPLMRDPRSRRRVIRSVTQAYTRHADALGIPPASVPAEVGALNQEVISRLRRTPVKRSRTAVTPDEGSSLA
ncbi:unnamed protein product [Closterium sp. Naga37s-1]|nr:unnamed protein product [Closterium sp. Naga37s-1]